MSTSHVTPGSLRAPLAHALYDPDAERDACGFAFVATLRGTPGRDIVDAGLTALLTLDARVKAWNKAFWQTPPEPLPAGHVPRGMVGATGALVAASLALTVFAGPLYAYTGRAAQALADRTPYIQAVLPEGDRGAGRSAHLASDSASEPAGAG